MSDVDRISGQILHDLLSNFQTRALNAAALKSGYPGVSLSSLKASYGTVSEVDYDLALKELETKKLIGTGPKVPYENKPGSGVMMLGVYSKREYAYLTEQGYKAAPRAAPSERPEQRSAAQRPKRETPEAAHFYAIHPVIEQKCASLYEAGEFAAAVELSFKIVRDRLRELTTHFETGSEAFGKGHLHIQGAAATHVDEDFNKGVQFLLMSIDRFRNEKSHTADSRIDDPVRAHQYLSLSSLALSLLEKAEILKP